jgi:hypothetical protein
MICPLFFNEENELLRDFLLTPSSLFESEKSSDTSSADSCFRHQTSQTNHKDERPLGRIHVVEEKVPFLFGCHELFSSNLGSYSSNFDQA